MHTSEMLSYNTSLNVFQTNVINQIEVTIQISFSKIYCEAFYNIDTIAQIFVQLIILIYSVTLVYKNLNLY